MSICNLRCHYCYLGQRPIHFEGIQPTMQYTPEEVGYALRKERIGGCAYTNFCADGETLLVKNIDKYVRAVVEQGHYAEVVTNLTITPVLDKFLAWPRELFEKIEFKCSFHYLELKQKGKLEVFVKNVHKIWEAGGSANIEITPSDELIPCIDEIMEFSIKHFGALPHLTIARDDRTNGIDYLTNLPIEEYDKVWSRFGSTFWEFKKTFFGKKQKSFCYAGMWGCYIDLTTGDTTKCYGCGSLGNIFKTPDGPFPSAAIGKCPIAHCYNGHMLLSLGYIPGLNNVRYGDIRDREMSNEIVAGRKYWLNPTLKAFFNTKLEDSNKPLSMAEMAEYRISSMQHSIKLHLVRIKGGLYRMIKR